MEGLGRIDRGVVGGLLLAPRRRQLALQERGGGRERRDPNQRCDQLAGVQGTGIDGVVGARIGDEPVHVEVLRDPHRGRRSDPEPARGVGRVRGRVVGRGGLSRVPLRAHLLDDPRALGPREGGLGLLLLPELVRRVVGLERAVGMSEAREELPVGLRDVGTALQLSLDDQGEGRALHPADREKVRAEAARGKRYRAGQRRAPDQVDVLAGGAGVGEVVGELVELRERALDLGLGERGVARALDRRAVGDRLTGDPRIGLEDLLERLEPDQLALAIEVGGDHRLVGVLGDLADRLDDVLVGRLLRELGVDQLVEVGLLPVRVSVRERRVHDVTLEADRHVVAARVRPGVVRDLVGRIRLGLAAAEDVGDPLR